MKFVNEWIRTIFRINEGRIGIMRKKEYKRIVEIRNTNDLEMEESFEIDSDLNAFVSSQN